MFAAGAVWCQLAAGSKVVSFFRMASEASSNTGHRYERSDRTLLRAPGLATRNKKLLGAPGIATKGVRTLQNNGFTFGGLPHFWVEGRTLSGTDR